MPSDQFWNIVRAIPHGRVVSYGALGRAYENPVSGLVAGRWMHHVPDGVLWWRVVGSKGDILIGKESPHLAEEQRMRLEAEGIKFEGGRVPSSAFIDASDLLNQIAYWLDADGIT